MLFNPPVRRPIDIDVPAPPLLPRPRPPRRWGQDIIALASARVVVVPLSLFV